MLFYVRIQPRRDPPVVPKPSTSHPSPRKRARLLSAPEEATNLASTADPDSIPLSKRFKLQQQNSTWQHGQQRNGHKQIGAQHIAQRPNGHQEQTQLADMKQHAAALLAGHSTDSSSTCWTAGLAKQKAQPNLPSSVLHTHSNTLGMRNLAHAPNTAPPITHSPAAVAKTNAVALDSQKAATANGHAPGVRTVPGLSEPEQLHTGQYPTVCTTQDAHVPSGLRLGSDGTNVLHSAAACSAHIDATSDAARNGGNLLCTEASSVSAGIAPAESPASYCRTATAKESTSLAPAHTASNFVSKQQPPPRLRSVYQPSKPTTPATSPKHSSALRHSAPTSASVCQPAQLQHDDSQLSREGFPMQFGKPSRSCRDTWHTSVQPTPRSAPLSQTTGDQEEAIRKRSPDSKQLLEALDHPQAGQQQEASASASGQQTQVLPAAGQKASNSAAAPATAPQKRKAGMFKSMQTCIVR